jgi:hypothetical protein
VVIARSCSNDRGASPVNIGTRASHAALALDWGAVAVVLIKPKGRTDPAPNATRECGDTAGDGVTVSATFAQARDAHA